MCTDCCGGTCCPACCTPAPPEKQRKKSKQGDGITMKQHKNGSIELRIGRQREKTRKKRKPAEPDPCCGDNGCQFLTALIIFLIIGGGIAGYIMFNKNKKTSVDGRETNAAPPSAPTPSQSSGSTGDGGGTPVGGCECDFFKKKPRCEDPEERPTPWEVRDTDCTWTSGKYSDGGRCINVNTTVACTTTTSTSTVSTTTITTRTTTKTATTRTSTTKTKQQRQL